MKNEVFSFNVVNIKNKSCHIIKSNLLELNYLYGKFLKLVNNLKDNAEINEIIKVHQNISEKYSQLYFKNALEFYSKKISNSKYKKNIKLIKKFEPKYYYSCTLISKNITDTSFTSKYLEYVNATCISKTNKIKYYDYYNSFFAFEMVHRKQIKISFFNIYDLMDLSFSHAEKEKIYKTFSNKIKSNETKFEKYILELINKNAKTTNYFIFTMLKHGIKDNYINMAIKVIENCEIIQQYITYKRNLLGIKDIFHLELFSYYYNFNQDFCLDSNKILSIFSDFGDEYIKKISEFLDEKIFINKSISNKGLTITDLSGHGFTVLKSLNETAVDSIFILVHELGHLSYNYYSKNKIVMSNDIMFSEISAIIHELILNEYLIENKILNDNIYFLDSIFKIVAKGIENFKLLKSIYNLKNIDYFSVKDEYYKIIKELYQDQIVIEEGNIDFIIDNFIFDETYYLRYMLALIISVNIFIGMKNCPNGIAKYIEFLKYSSLCSNIDEAVKIVGIDLNQKSTYKNVVNYLYNLMKNND